MSAKVVSQEEVDALMRGFDSASADPPTARPGAIPLRPGEAVSLSLGSPSPARVGPRPAWREGPRPIDALLAPRVRPAAAVALRSPVRARHPVSGDVTDYWPAYADVLSNVVLNLLFLVAIFTMGLVVLNQEVIRVQVRLAEERARAILEQRRAETQAQTRPRAEPRPTPPAEPVAALPPEPAPPRAAEPAPAAERPVREFTIRRAPSTAPVPAPTPVPRAGTPSPALTAEAAATGLVGGRFVARLTFDLRDASWPVGRPLVGADSISAEDRRALVAFAPADNRRLMTQAFSRLSSVRSAMVAAGVPARNIVLRIAPLPPELEGDEVASSSVYVINLGGS
jgi:hypothetical protein